MGFNVGLGLSRGQRSDRSGQLRRRLKPESRDQFGQLVGSMFGLHLLPQLGAEGFWIGTPLPLLRQGAAIPGVQSLAFESASAELGSREVLGERGEPRRLEFRRYRF